MSGFTTGVSPLGVAAPSRRRCLFACSGGAAAEQPPPRQSRSQRLRKQGKLMSLEKKIEQQRRRERELSTASEVDQESAESEEPTLVGDANVAAHVAVEVMEGAPPRAQQPGPEATLEAEASLPSEQPSTAMEAAKETMRAEISRKAQALLDIIQSGAEVDAAIARHKADIDDTMLELLTRRMEAARQLERSEEVLKGLRLLYDRLKAEADRKRASPALRLLDTLLAILDDDAESAGGREGGSGGAPPRRPVAQQPAKRAEARRGVAARLRAAFGDAPLHVDVVTLAQQLASGGQPVADELLEEAVEPAAFMEEVNALVARAQSQQAELEAAAASLAVGTEERKRVDAVAVQRKEAIELVQEVLALARAVAPARR